MEEHARLADCVRDSGGDLLVVVEVVHVDAAFEAEAALDGYRRDPDDADGTCGLRLGRPNQCRREELRKEVRADAINTELQFVALGRLRPWWRVHHPRIVEQDVQLLFAVEELFRGCIDGSQVRQVQRQEYEFSGPGGWNSLLDVVDRLRGFIMRAGRDVDFGAFRIE